MTTRTLKLLTASTAFVAAASAANAVDLVDTVTTTTVHTSETSAGILNVSGTTGIISVTAAPAIAVSGTGAITVNTSSTSAVRSDDAGATIQLQADSAVTGVTINNSGTIANVGSGHAIDVSIQNASAANVAVTVRNTGTISGSVNVGNGGLTYTSNGGTQNGDINAGTGTNNITLENATMTGDLNLVNGTNTAVIKNTTLTGSYAGGTGNDNLTLTNATVTGALAGGAGGGTDELTINGNRTYTVAASSGGINGFETINIETDVILNDGISGANTMTIDASKTLTVNQQFSMATGTINNNGNFNIAGGETVAAQAFNAGLGSTVGLGMTNSSTIGKLSIASGGAGFSDSSVTINVGANSGYIASGTQIEIIENQGGATIGNVDLTNANTGVYRFSTAANADGVSLTIGRIATADAVTGGVAKSAANALDTIGVNATGALETIHSQIGQAATAAEVQNIVNGLTPSIDGAGLASINVAVDTGNQISNRLASLRGTGVATGDAMASSHMWLQGFGSSVDQDNDGGNFGYDSSTGGMSLGLDTDSFVNGMTTGMAVSYARSTVDSKSTNNASTDVDSYAATLYGSRVFDGGLFINGQVGAGFNQYEMSRNVAGVGTAKGDTDGWQGTAKIEAGQDIAAGGFTLTPLASLQYTYLKMDEYTETGVGNAGLTVDPDAMSTIDAGLGGKVAYAIPLTDGGTLKPSVHAKYIYRMGDRELATTSSFLGAAGTSFNTTGVEADRSSVNLGAGLLLTTVGGTDLSLNYDADIRSNLTGHTGQLKARWAF